MTKEEFQKLENEAQKELEADAVAKMQNDINDEFIWIWNHIFDFCQDYDLEPDPVIDIIKSKMSREHKRQMNEDGYITKI